MNRFRRRRTKKLPIAYINMTPFIDVLLVLLVIFMIAAPALNNPSPNTSVPVNLPAGKGRAISKDDKPLIITVKNNGDIYWENTLMTFAQLNEKLAALAKSDKNKKIFVRGDKTVSYGNIMTVMNAMSEKGLGQVSLITQSIDN